VSDHVSPAPPGQPIHLSQSFSKTSDSQVASQPESPAVAHSQRPRFQPLQQDEVAAFKRALANASAPRPLSASGEILTSGRRNPAPPEEFEDTQMVDPDKRASPLGVTQYGEIK